jgi:hypothetical protein
MRAPLYISTTDALSPLNRQSFIDAINFPAKQADIETAKQALILLRGHHKTGRAANIHLGERAFKVAKSPTAVRRTRPFGGHMDADHFFQNSCFDSCLCDVEMLSSDIGFRSMVINNIFAIDEIIGNHVADSITHALLLDVFKHAGGMMAFHGKLFLLEKPKVWKVDPEGRLHSEKGPAIVWQDGTKVYAWRNQIVPKSFFNKRTMTAKKVLRIRNADQKAAAMEIVGWEKIFQELDAEILDRDDDPEIGTLWAAHSHIGDLPSTVFLEVKCGTGRKFFIPVDEDCRTAKQAQAWIYGDSHFIPVEVRT